MRIAAVIITCAGREDVCRGTIDALKATDWPGAWPVLVSWDHGIDGSPQHRQQLNALNALRAGIGLEPDFILFLEDDVAFNAHLSHNLTHWRPLRSRLIGMASLYNPTIHAVERSGGQHWFRADAGAVYGSQAYVFSLDTARFVAAHWHEIEGMQDIKMSRLTAKGGWPIYYHRPSLVQHTGRHSTWGGGYHSAPDFDARFRANGTFDRIPFGALSKDPRFKDYSEIPGWFDEEWLYDWMIGSADDGATFVEVGCWLGKGTAYCARRIRECARRIAQYAVDTWEGWPNEPAMLETVRDAGGSVYPLFCRNLEEAGVLDTVHPLKMPSKAAAALFADGTLDFVFIDADHSVESVQADIAWWRPKIKSGGTLAGHDWNTYASVQEAVRAMLGNEFTVEGNCWLYQQR
jgi:Methyltransferase domain